MIVGATEWISYMYLNNILLIDKTLFFLLSFLTFLLLWGTRSEIVVAVVNVPFLTVLVLVIRRHTHIQGVFHSQGVWGIVSISFVEEFFLWSVKNPCEVLSWVKWVSSYVSMVVLKPSIWMSSIVDCFLVCIVNPLLLRIVFNVRLNDNISPWSRVILSGQNVVVLCGLIWMENEASIWLQCARDWLLLGWRIVWLKITVNNINLKSDIWVLWNFLIVEWRDSL